MPITGTPTVGMRVSYDDVANPKRVGTVVAVNTSCWGTDYTVRWSPFYGGKETRSDLRQHGWNTAPETCDWCGRKLEACENRRNGTICPEYADPDEVDV